MDIYTILGLILLAAAAFTVVAIGIGVVASDASRRGQADRLLVTLQGLEQMGDGDSEEYAEINRRYAAVNVHLGSDLIPPTVARGWTNNDPEA